MNREIGEWGGAEQVAEKRFHAVILSAAKDLALRIFMNNARFFLRYAQDRLRLLRMTAPTSFSAAREAPPFRQLPKCIPAW